MSSQKSKIPTYLKFGLLCMLLLLLYYPDLRSMVSDWSDKKEYSHGFLIPLISGYLIWSKRERLLSMPVLPDIIGLLILSAGIILLALGHVAFEPFTRRFSLIITITGLVYLLLGKGVCKELLFPLGYLVFMIPLPYIVIKGIAVSLRLVSSTVTYNAIKLMGIPILQEGVFLELPNITLEVADLCTGILSLISILALAVFYAYLTQRNLISRLALILISIPVAVFSNMLRLIMTVGLAYIYGQSVLSSFIHQFHGTVNFIINIIVLVITGELIRKADIKIKGAAR